jgi:hypothetical protein
VSAELKQQALSSPRHGVTAESFSFHMSAAGLKESSLSAIAALLGAVKKHLIIYPEYLYEIIGF